MASILEVCNGRMRLCGLRYGSVVMGNRSADIISVQAMLKDAGFKVKEINMNAYMKARTMIQEFMGRLPRIVYQS